MIKEIKLLNHQYEVLADRETKILGMIAGYGSGKTYTACRKAIDLSFLNEGCVGIITEPTFPMLRDIFIPEMKLALEEWGITYKFNASNSIFTFNVNGKENKLICMSMENVERLVGINAAFAICDEFDTSKAEIAYKAYIKLLGRLRSGNVRQFVIVTTPEGFKAAYKIFIEEKASNKRLIKARTLDNKYLPADFIDTLKQQYPPNLLKAYLEGEFVNLTSGAVYNYFDREKHDTNREVQENDILYIGQDFNIGSCCGAVIVEEKGKPLMVSEYDAYDTQSVINYLNKTYPDHKRKGKIYIVPDASGDSNKTNSSETDISLFKKAGFKIKAPSKNPPVKDRINSVNNLFYRDEFLINIYKCPETAKALEQQAYNEKGEPEKFNGAGTVDDRNDAVGYPIHHIFGITKHTTSSISIF